MDGNEANRDYVLLLDVAAESAASVALAARQAIPEALVCRQCTSLAAARALAECRPPLLVLTALQLEDGQGLELLAAVRRALPECPLVVLARMADAGLESAVLAAGADDFLVLELLGRHELRRTLRHWLWQQHSGQYLQLLQNALEAVACCVLITDPQTRIEWVNPAFTQLTGYSRAEALGKTPRQLFWSGKNDPQCYRDLWKALWAGESWHGELINRRRDGRECEEEVSITPVFSAGGHLEHYIAFKRDISARRAVEQRVRESEEKLEILLASLPDAVFEIDPFGRVVYAHLPPGCWFVDAASLHLPGSYSRLLPAPVAQILEEMLDEVQGRRQSCARQIVLPVAEEERCYQLTLSPLLDAGAGSGGFLAVFRDCTEQHRQEETIRGLAYYDPLTRLPNRRLLLDRLQQAMANSARKKLFGGLLFIDLDRFKELNDSRGHEVGDRYLVAVADRLRDCLRAGDTAARLGGDEFILMLPDLGGERSEAFSRLAAVCDKIMRLLERPVEVAGEACRGSASIGALLFHGADCSPETLLSRADKAMYRAKAAGRSAWRLANDVDAHEAERG